MVAKICLVISEKEIKSSYCSLKQNYLEVSIAANLKGVCLQNTSKFHPFHLKIW